MRKRRIVRWVGVALFGLAVLLGWMDWRSRCPNIVFDGNSLFAGHGLKEGESAPDQVLHKLGWRWVGHNVAVSSQTTIDLLKRSKATDALYRKSAPLNICVVWEITNDLYFGATASDAESRIEQYCRDRRTAGYRVIVLTVLPRKMPPGSDFESKRIACNDFVRNHWIDFADRLADVAMPPLEDYRDGRYFLDGTHLNRRGNSLVADSILAQIRNIPYGAGISTGITAGLVFTNTFPSPGGTGP
jgi:lysophospholipase L1-like esterase